MISLSRELEGQNCPYLRDKKNIGVLRSAGLDDAVFRYKQLKTYRMVSFTVGDKFQK